MAATILALISVGGWVGSQPPTYGHRHNVEPHARLLGHSRAGPIVMQRLGAGSQFEERPMKDINRSGPSEERLSRVQALMTQLEKSGRTSAARTMLNAKRAELASTPKMDKEIEESHRAEIELARLCAADMMRCGDIDGAIKALRAVQPWLCTVTEFGSAVLLDLAMALDAKRDPAATDLFGQLSRSPNADVRALAKMMGSVDDAEGFLKF